MNDDIIETRGLTRRFGAFSAVQDLNLHVPAGSVYAFLGPNGAGKTTTIRMLLGLIRPSAGEALLFQRPPRAAGRVGALVESPALYPHLTVLENLQVTCCLLGLPRRAALQALALTGMEKEMRRLVSTCSLGMRHRLGLSLALLNLPPLVILDEPTNGLDPAGIQEMRSLLTNLPRQHGVTVFLSSHLLNEVEQVASHVGILNKGRMVFQGELCALQARQTRQLCLRAESPAAALNVLQRSGVRATLMDDGELRAPVSGHPEAARLNALLGAAGCGIYHLALEQPSLEDIFFLLTSASAG